MKQSKEPEKITKIEELAMDFLGILFAIVIVGLGLALLK